MADKLNRSSAQTTSRFEKTRSAALERSKGQTYKIGRKQRGPKLARGNARAAKVINVRRLRKNLSNLSFKNMLMSQEQRMRQRLLAPIVGAPRRVFNSLFFDSGVAGLLVPVQNLVYMIESLQVIDSNYKKEADEVLEEIEEELEDEAEESIPERMEEHVGLVSTFRDYQTGLFTRLDTIIRHMINITETNSVRPVVPRRVHTAHQELSRNDDEEQTGFQRMLALLGAGLAGISFSAINNLFGGGDGRGTISDALRTGTEIGIGAFAGQQLGRMRRDLRRNSARQERRARNTRARNNVARVRNRRRGATLRRPIAATRRVTGRVARTAGRFSSGLSTVFRTLSRIARVAGIAGALAIPVIEWMEGSQEITELANSYNNGSFRPDLTGEARSRAYAIAESQIVVEGVADTIGIVGGAAIGGLLGGGVLSLLTGAAGAWLGERLAEWFNDNYADDVAAAIVDSGAANRLSSFVNALSSMNLADFVDSAGRAMGPVGMVTAAPIAAAIRGLELINDPPSNVRRQIAPPQVPNNVGASVGEATPTNNVEGDPLITDHSARNNLTTPTRTDQQVRPMYIFRTDRQINNNTTIIRAGMR